MVKNRFVNQKLGKRVSRRQELAKSKIQLERKIRPERGLSKSSRRGA
jgi:hypothetical protein